VHKLTVTNLGETFDAAEDETMLDALLRNGVRVRYGCRRGKCSSCKHLVVDGDYDNSAASAYALLEDEREAGMTLLCQSYPTSDCTVELLIAPGDEDGVRLPTPQRHDGRITEVIEESTQLLSIRLALSTPLRFLPGQYLELGSRGAEETRSYSIASAPMFVRRPQLLVHRRAGGWLSPATGAEAVDVRGPFGAMYLRPSGRRAVLVAWTEGVAPMASIARYLGMRPWSAPVTLLHGAAEAEELAYSAEFAAIAARTSGFEYLPVAGTERVMTLALNEAIAPGEDVDVYVAGPVGFCDRTLFILEARGIEPTHIYLERFYPAGAAT
jgi:NAD(P)H-flavin reductase/ferredoxin